MIDKVRSLLMLLVCAYIALMGGDLIVGIIKGTSEKPMFYGIVGPVFVVLGILVVLYNIKRTKEIERRLDEEAAAEEAEEQKTSMLMVGAYIAFMGGDLIVGIIKGTSEKPMFYGIVGTVFVVLGILVVLYNIKRTKEIERRLDEEAAAEEAEEQKTSNNEE